MSDEELEKAIKCWAGNTVTDEECMSCPYSDKCTLEEISNEIIKRWRECKSENTELRARLDKAVEFKYKLGDIVYFFTFSEREVYHGKVIGIYLNYYSPSNPIWIKVQYDIPMIVKDTDTEVLENMVFTNREEAEARLAELKGEKR